MSQLLNYKKIFDKNNNQESNLKKKLSNETKTNEPKPKLELKPEPEPESNIKTNTFDVNQKNYKAWSDFFHTNGYIILSNAIEPNQITKLKEELVFAENKNKFKKIDSDRHIVHKCFFENSPTTLNLIESSVLYDFAQYLIADVPG